MAYELNGLTMRGGGGRGKSEALRPIQTSAAAGITGAAEEEPLSPGARVFHEPLMNCCIIAVIGIKTPIAVQVMKKGLSETLINHPRFSTKFDTETPVKGGPGTEKKPKRIVRRILSLDDIKFIKTQFDMTINDVLLGITQAGLSQYLNRKYGNKKDNLPKDIRLRATVLVNVRPSSGIQELANLMEKGSKCKWGNSIGYIILPLSIALRDDPLDYIRQAKAAIGKKKRSLEAKCTHSSSKLMLHSLGEKAVAALSYRLVTHTTMSFSNVVGPAEEVSFYGHPIAYIAPTGIGHPQALTVHYQSYADKMTLVVAVDEDVIPDPRLLCDDIAQSLTLIKGALTN